MAVKMFRDCGSEIFNTGTSKCPFVPDYISDHTHSGRYDVQDIRF